MRPSRRAALTALLAGGVLGGIGLRGWAIRHRDGGEAREVAVRSRPIARFSRREPGRERFGALAFRSGLELRSDDPGFGGFSGLWRSVDGGRIATVTDRGRWLTAAVEREAGRLAGLGDAWMASILGPRGPLRPGTSSDVESLAVGEGAAYLGLERMHQVLRVAWDGAGPRGPGEPLSLPPEIGSLPANKGLEALALAPAASPLQGALVAVAERARWGDDAPTRGFILAGPLAGAFDLVRSGAFDITDLAFLESGEALLLERRYALLHGPATRIRRVSGDAIRPGALVDGPVIFQAGDECEIDNMEGLAVHRDAEGRTLLTLVSDDNFSPLQRTLLLEFALEG